MSIIQNCRVLDLPRIHDDRGSLSFVEAGAQIPFAIARIYYLYNVPNMEVRGAHAHKALQQLIIPISGSFDIEIDDGSARKIIRLNRPDQGLYVCPMIWRDLSKFSSGAVCLVLASEKYDEADYIRNYDEFIGLVKDKK